MEGHRGLSTLLTLAAGSPFPLGGGLQIFGGTGCLVVSEEGGNSAHVDTLAPFYSQSSITPETFNVK